MELYRVVQALENRGLLVSTDLDAHQYCQFDSNCPKAVEIRRFMLEAKITLPDLIAGIAELTANSNTIAEQVAQSITPVRETVDIEVYGQPLKVNVSEVIEGPLRLKVIQLMKELQDKGVKLKQLGKDLYSTLERELVKAREVTYLPQLEHTIPDMVKYQAMITSTEHKYYNILMPLHYRATQIVKRLNSEDIRYAINPDDVTRIEQDVYIKFKYLQDMTTAQKPTLFKVGSNDTLIPFAHYHGNMGECWGKMPLPPRWNGELRTLFLLKNKLEGSLRTVNYDSPYNREPSNMPTLEEIYDRSTPLGTVVGEDIPVIMDADGNPRREWGGGRRPARG